MATGLKATTITARRPSSGDTHWPATKCLFEPLTCDTVQIDMQSATEMLSSRDQDAATAEEETRVDILQHRIRKQIR